MTVSTRTANVYISLPYGMAARTAGINKMKNYVTVNVCMGQEKSYITAPYPKRSLCEHAIGLKKRNWDIRYSGSPGKDRQNRDGSGDVFTDVLQWKCVIYL